MARIRTGYSFRSAAGYLDSVLNRIVECGYSAAPITDRSSTFGWTKWNLLCQNKNIKPVFGVELGVTPSYTDKRPIVDYWTFIAIDDIAVVNRLVETATQQFRYEPLLTYEQAMQVDGVYKIAGHRSNLSLINPQDHLWISLSPSSSKGYIHTALKNNHKLIKTSDNNFPTKEEFPFYEILCGRNASRQTYDQHIQTQDEWLSSIGHIELEQCHIDNAISHFDFVLNNTNASLRKGTLIKPHKEKTLRQMCEEGAERLGISLNDPIYLDRLNKELDVISEKNFEDYFHIVADICQYARERMIVGPARGSSCGSLTCYLLNITTIDPLKYGLIFERFIDINRKDLPDIDIDFSDQQRDLIFTYISNRYGNDHVARLGSVSLFKSAALIKEAGYALKIPNWKCDILNKNLIHYPIGDPRSLNTLEDTFDETKAGQDILNEFPSIRIIEKMEGHPRHYSQHAAGIIISELPITDYVAKDHRTNSIMCDKRDAEELNLLKIDILGLTQLSVIEDCLRLANLPKDILQNIDLNDQKAFDVLNEKKFSGIFQFNGQALQGLVKQFKVTCLDDIISITALARPGPMGSGGAQEWVDRKYGKFPIIYPHPLFKPYLQDTLGIIIYQEQVMDIARHIGGLEWSQVQALRKAMGKSLGKEYFDQFGDPWKQGAIANGISEETANQVWRDLCAYGAWAFNKSHSVAYGIISYYCCWLKAHYSFEFAAATLTHEMDPQKQIELLREMKNEGYEYIPIDKNLSIDKWTVSEKSGVKYLIGPLTNIKGIGTKSVKAIMGARERGERLSDKTQKILDNPITPIDSLYPFRDTVARLFPDLREKNILSSPVFISELDNITNNREVLILCTVKKADVKTKPEKNNREYLNLTLLDDTGSILGRIGENDFERIGKFILDHGKFSKCLYAMKGKIWRKENFQMFIINTIRYLGDM